MSVPNVMWNASSQNIQFRGAEIAADSSLQSAIGPIEAIIAPEPAPRAPRFIDRLVEYETYGDCRVFAKVAKGLQG